MQGEIKVRGLAPEKPYEWSAALESEDPVQLDTEADRLREQCGVHRVQLKVSLARGEKAKLTRAVLQRDQRKCRKCGSTLDVQVVELRYREYHNAAHLVTLCRSCRHARSILLEHPYDEAVVWTWIANGRRGIDELVDKLRTDEPERYQSLVDAMGVDGAAEFLADKLTETMFGANPLRGRRPSPHLMDVLYERGKDANVPDVFTEDETDAK